MKGSSEAHEELINEILATFGHGSNLRIWKNNTGKGRSFDGKRVLKWGLKGSADIIGIGFGGKFIGIECKTGEAEQNSDQENFQEMINCFGGVYIVARSIKDVQDMINKNSQQLTFDTVRIPLIQQ